MTTRKAHIPVFVLTIGIKSTFVSRINLKRNDILVLCGSTFEIWCQWLYCLSAHSHVHQGSD